MHFAWEIVQLPLYTLWNNPDKGAIAYAIVHCTLGDLLIAASSLFLGCVVARWLPLIRNDHGFLLGTVTVSSGVLYTLFSEWNNTVVLRSWAYSDLMPQVFGIGVAPIAQWIVIPALLFFALRKRATRLN